MANSYDIDDVAMSQRQFSDQTAPLLQQERSSSSHSQDSESIVIQQTAGVFQSFFTELLSIDRSRLPADDLPSPHELGECCMGMVSDVFYTKDVAPEAQVQALEAVTVLPRDNRSINRCRSSPCELSNSQASCDNNAQIVGQYTNSESVNDQRCTGQSISDSNQNSVRPSSLHMNAAQYLPSIYGQEYITRRNETSGTTNDHLRNEFHRRQAFSESEAVQQMYTGARQNQNQDLNGSPLTDGRRINSGVSASSRNSRRRSEGVSEEEVDGGIRDMLRSIEDQVGRRLAQIGDEVNERYSNDFTEMVRILKLTPSTAYEGFAFVARQLFRDGVINWGRIVVLLCFGYRLVIAVAERGVVGLFSKLVNFVVSFIVQEKISRWIAAQGGWRAALRYVPECLGWPAIGIVCALAAVSVAAVFCFSNH